MDLGDYVEVKDRLRLALAQFPDLRVVERTPYVLEVADRTFLVCSLDVHRDANDQLPVQAAAWEPLPGRTPYTRDSELMVGMTSALGRALGYMGFGIGKSIASANEVKNRPPESPQIDANAAGGTKGAHMENRASEAQSRAIFMIAKKKGVEMPDVTKMTKAEASDWIESMDKR